MRHQGQSRRSGSGILRWPKTDQETTAPRWARNGPDGPRKAGESLDDTGRADEGGGSLTVHLSVKRARWRVSEVTRIEGVRRDRPHVTLTIPLPAYSRKRVIRRSNSKRRHRRQKRPRKTGPAAASG